MVEYTIGRKRLVSVERCSCSRDVWNTPLGGGVNGTRLLGKTVTSQIPEVIKCKLLLPHLHPSRSHCHSPAPPMVQPFTLPPLSPSAPSDAEGEWPITTVARQGSGKVHPSQAVFPTC